MKDLLLNDRDVFAIFNVLNKAIDEAEFCFEGNRHSRMVLLKLKQHVENRIKEEGSDFESKLKLNL